MIEEEAKTKWCPFVRFHIEGKAPHFTVTPNREQRGTRCMASACMAWRWVMVQTNTVHPMMAVSVDYKPIYEPTEQGYCGLAGRE